MEFSWPEYWSGWPFPSPGDLPNPEIRPKSPRLQTDSLLSEPLGLRRMEWGAYPFSSRSPQPRSRTRVSCIAGGFFTNWAIREAQGAWVLIFNFWLKIPPITNLPIGSFLLTQEEQQHAVKTNSRAQNGFFWGLRNWNNDEAPWTAASAQVFWREVPCTLRAVFSYYLGVNHDFLKLEFSCFCNVV